MKSFFLSFTMIFFVIAVFAQVDNTRVKIPAGFVSLFNGKDLTNWKIPEGDNGHWKVVNM